MKSFNTLCVAGLGYIGLPTAAVFAKAGLRVLGVDVDEKTVEAVNAGKACFQEADLEGLLHHVVQSGALRAAMTPEPADAFIIAVPTPFTEEHSADLSFVEQASRAIAPHIAEGNLVILESTVPPGTTEAMTRWIMEERPDLAEKGGPGKAFHAAHCPERVLPGRILAELVENDRIIGGMTEACALKARELYEIFVRGECVTTRTRTAELAKLTENSFRDVNIAFANELASICDRLNIDVWELIALANRHPRVNILKPGPGVGGHCIAVDPWFIVGAVPEEARMIRLAREINDARPGQVIARVTKAASRFKHPVVACLGLTFKADIDDIRESPSLEIAAHLADTVEGRVLAVEPNIAALPKALADKKIELTSLAAALDEADILVLLVDHRQFRNVPRGRLTEKIVIDTRGIWR